MSAEPVTSVRVKDIAAACHEVNRVLQLALGEEPSPHWESAPDWQVESAVAGVHEALRGASPAQLHQSWCDQKYRDGWVHGPAKDEDDRTHPCLVPYDELPESQKVKDYTFQAVVKAMATAVGSVA